jgi:hypothetical protein
MSSATEKFTIACPKCGEVVSVSRAHVGKKGRCKRCQTVFPIVGPDDLVELPSSASSAAPRSSMWDDGELQLSPTPQAAQQVETTTKPPSLADDYMLRAREYKGPTIQQEENDPNYRFMTSYGSVIGGSATIIFGLMFMAFCIMFILSAKLLILPVMIIGAGIGWLVQGLNYVTYYRWKDREGRG